MEDCMDMLNLLDHDTCRKIFMCLDGFDDVFRASAVSRSWHSFVVENGICRQLCLRMFPSLLKLDRVIQVDDGLVSSEGVGPSRYTELALDRDHFAFASLARACRSSAVVNCLSEAISASSTDNFPEESVHNTLEPGNRVGRRASYWSSTGQSNPAVPETLIYELCSKICVISQINIQFFEAYFQLGLPIYSVEFVRFRIGRPKNPKENIDSVIMSESPEPADDKFIWTYTSEAFPMAQVNGLQKFNLPEPVLCIGGFLQIELMGRVQTQAMDSMFYVCVAHVQALGRPLSPAFDVDILEPAGNFVLKYFPHLEIDANGSDLSEDTAGGDSSSYYHVSGLVNVEYEWEDDSDDSDEEFVA